MFLDGVMDPTGDTVRPGEGMGHGLEFCSEDIEQYRIA